MTLILEATEAGFNRLLQILIALVAGSIGLFAILIPFNLLLIKANWGAIWWLHEAVEYALYVGIFLGAPWVLQQGAHVRVDVFSTNLPRRLAVQLERLLDCFGAGLCVILCFYGARAAIWEFEDGTLPDKDLRIANWYMLAVFAISFFLLTLEFLFRFRRARAIVDEDASKSVKASF
ncbi:MAG: TRAP transporter small permease [Hyphomicrobiales bacterium]|nr:TRAP transporter small permease [Hyphomicrobiales bacterium]MCP4932785.1 TRAP transporter small permease [bacterium]